MGSFINSTVNCSAFSILNRTGTPYFTSLSGVGNINLTVSTRDVTCSLSGNQASQLGSPPNKTNVRLAISNFSGVATSDGTYLFTPAGCPEGEPLGSLRADFSPPKLVDSSIDLGTGAIVLTFDEPIMQDTLNISSLFTPAAISYPGMAIVMAADRSRFTSSLSCSRLQTVANSTRASLTVTSPVVSDLAGNVNSRVGDEFSTISYPSEWILFALST